LDLTDIKQGRGVAASDGRFGVQVGPEEIPGRVERLSVAVLDPAAERLSSGCGQPEGSRSVEQAFGDL
jgi:hypothetical protein